MVAVLRQLLPVHSGVLTLSAAVKLLDPHPILHGEIGI
jgi:hypothetical protein